MEWLEAALAFVVIMMVFSTMVSVIIESGHRVFRIREKGLRKLMVDIYEEAIWPCLSDKSHDKSAAADDFTERMTSSRFRPLVKNTKKGKKGILFRIVNAGHIKSLTTLEFIERFAETTAGQSIMSDAERRGKQYMETFLKHLASKYEDFGVSATDYFKRRSHLISVIVAICLSFALNVNAIHLYKSLLVNKDSRQQIIERGNEVAKKLEVQEEELKRVIQNGAENEKENLDKIEGNIQELNETAKSLMATGIPIGWDTAPWKQPEWKQLKSKDQNASNNPKDTGKNALRYAKYILLLFPWFGSVLLSGLLIGLGGPFWFDTFRKLSAITGVVRGFQTPAQKEKDEQQRRRGKIEDKPNEKSRITEIYETASKARVLNKIGGRALLTPEGNIEKGGSTV